MTAPLQLVRLDGDCNPPSALPVYHPLASGVVRCAYHLARSSEMRRDRGTWSTEPSLQPSSY
jgi:hypothetical protein